MHRCPRCHSDQIEELHDGRTWCDHCRAVITDQDPATDTCPVPFSRRRKDIDE